MLPTNIQAKTHIKIDQIIQNTIKETQLDRGFSLHALIEKSIFSQDTIFSISIGRLVFSIFKELESKIILPHKVLYFLLK
jgi:hypothetical protein